MASALSADLDAANLRIKKLEEELKFMTGQRDIWMHDERARCADIAYYQAKLSRYEALEKAAENTLEENLHLTDGDDCTLRELRDALAALKEDT